MLTATQAAIWPSKIALWIALKFDPPPDTNTASLGGSSAAQPLPDSEGSAALRTLRGLPFDETTDLEGSLC